MVSQAPLKKDRAQPQPRSASAGLASISRDCWRLVELQARLGAIDLREFVARAMGPSVAILVAFLLGLAAACVGLAGLGELLAENTELSVGGAHAIVALVTLLAAGIAVTAAVTKLRAAIQPLERSRTELIANVRTIANALQSEDGMRSARTPFTTD